MTKKEIKQTIEELRDDENYYGELGRRFLSTSDIKRLVEAPDMYGQPVDESLALLKGTYLHRRLLQPELIKEMTIVDASTRNTKVYKDLVAENTLDGMEVPKYLLKKEADELEGFAKKAEANLEFSFGLQGDMKENEVEEPMVGEIFGYWFKGKADRINRHRGFIADIKTTKNLGYFTRNFRTFGYHAQAWVYEQLFGLPVRFYVISKEDGRLGVYDLSPETLSQGEDYVKWGLERLELYYGDKPEKDIDQYYDYMLL